jgi:hypothetical protein
MDLFKTPQRMIDECIDDNNFSNISGLTDPNIINECTTKVVKTEMIQCLKCNSKCTEIKEFGKNKILCCDKNHIWIYNLDKSMSVLLKQVTRCPICLDESINTTYIANYKLHMCSNDHTWGFNTTTKQEFELVNEKNDDDELPPYHWYSPLCNCFKSFLLW